MNNTLYVNFEDYIDDISVDKLKSRVFNILDDYDINNIVLNIISNNKDNYLIDEFIKEYHKKYNGNLLIK
jgi:hypothetical protein